MAKLFYEGWEANLGFVDQSAGTSEVLTGVIDCADAEEIAFVVFFGDATSGSVITCTVKENTASSTSSPTPTQVTLDAVGSGTLGVITSGSLVVTAGASDVDDKYAIISVAGSALSKRYAFLSVTPATKNCAFNGCLVFVKRRVHPITQTSTTISTAYAG